jgi:hypothetical protein
MKFEFSRQIFEKYSILFFKSVQWEPIYSMRIDETDGRTDRSKDRHDESKSRFWYFCERT